MRRNEVPSVGDLLAAVLRLLLVVLALPRHRLSDQREEKQREEDERKAVVTNPEPHQALEVGEADRDVEDEPCGDHAGVDHEHRAHREIFGRAC